MRFMKSTISRLKKEIVKYFPKKDLHGFEYTVKELVGLCENSKVATKWHGQLLNETILKYKTSDTIFILGSGPSINDISPQDWKYVEQHDSIGFNWWIVHDFIPSLYMFQAASTNMLELLKDKYSDYRNIPFLIRGSAFAKGEFDYEDERLNLLKSNPVYYIKEYPISSKCSIDINMLFNYMENLGFMTFGHIANFVPKWRSTLGLLISLSYQMGYQKIILCGMDMHDNGHFWDYEPYLELKKKYSLPDKDKSNIATFTDERISPNTMPRYVYSLHDWMYNKNGVKIFVMNKKTLLYPEIDLYERKSEYSYGE